MESIDSPPPASTVATPRFLRPSYFREVTWRWSDVLIAIAPLVVGRMESVVPRPAWLAEYSYWFSFGQGVVLMAWMLVFPLAIGRRRLGRWPHLPRARGVFVEAVLALLAAIALIFTLSLLSPFVVRLAGETRMPPNPLEHLARSNDRFVALSFMIMALVLAPVAEEVLFRGALYNFLRQRLHPIVAIGLQAAVFALLHPFDLANSTVVAICAVGIAALYEWRKTLLAPILMHTLTNGLMLLAVTLGLTPEANTPRLGVYGSPHDGGILVTNVAQGSAADEAGLQTGDLVTAVDGQPVADVPGLARIIRAKDVGDDVVVEFLRGARAHKVVAVLKLIRE